MDGIVVNKDVVAASDSGERLLNRETLDLCRRRRSSCVEHGKHLASDGNLHLHLGRQHRGLSASVLLRQVVVLLLCDVVARCISIERPEGKVGA